MLPVLLPLCVFLLASNSHHVLAVISLHNQCYKPIPSQLLTVLRLNSFVKVSILIASNEIRLRIDLGVSSPKLGIIGVEII